MIFDYAIVEIVEDNPPSVGISPQCWIESKPDGLFFVEFYVFMVKTMSME
jgi:hypothetical protein